MAQALAEQTSSIFQSFEFQGADALLTNILGPATHELSPAALGAVRSPTDVSPDRCVCVCVCVCAGVCACVCVRKGGEMGVKVVCVGVR